MRTADPLTIECFVCGALVGDPCRSILDDNVREPHVNRLDAANRPRRVVPPVYDHPAPREPQLYTARINGHEVLVTIWPAGLAQVAERADSGESWSAPETLSPVETVESEHTTPWRTEGPS